MTRSDDFAGIERFHDVDASGEQEMFMRFLEVVEAEPNVQELRRRTYELLELHDGAVVADVGCGLGTAARELAAAGARAIGFDASSAMIEEARRRSAGSDVTFEVADVGALPVESATLDGYRAERLYQHLDDPVGALAEARRVLAPGGRVVLVDPDWDTLVIDAADREGGRSVIRAFVDSIRNPWIGSRYRSLLLEAGFDDVAIHAVPFVYADRAFGEMMTGMAARAAADAGVTSDEWLADQRRRIAADRFFAAFISFVAVGRAAAHG